MTVTDRDMNFQNFLLRYDWMLIELIYNGIERERNRVEKQKNQWG